LRKLPGTRFVPKIPKLVTKLLNVASFHVLQTTPVPLRGTSPPDFRRGALKTSNLEKAGFCPHLEAQQAAPLNDN
jgi:hypothetical protein